MPNQRRIPRWSPLLPLFLLTTAVACLLLVFPEAAQASPEGTKLHRQALDAAQAGLYRKARVLWEKAYALDKEPKYLFNLGLVAEQSEKDLEALEYFERFVKEAANKEGYAGLVEKARQHIQSLLKQVATLRVVAKQPNVLVFVDQISLGRGPLDKTVRLTKGKHLVVGTLAGYYGETKTINLSEGQSTSIELHLQKIKPKVVQLRPKVVQTKTHLVYPMPKWLPWTLLGTGLAVAASGIAPILMQKKKYDEYNDSIDDKHPVGIVSIKDEGKKLGYVGIALFSVGGALAAAGLVTVLLNKPKVVPDKPTNKTPPVSIETSVGPGSLSLTLHF